jgi:hypothetical protein
LEDVENEEYFRLKCNPVQSGRSSAPFQKNALRPTSGSKTRPSTQAEKKKIWLLLPFSAYFFALKMEATDSSKTSANFYKTWWRHVPEGHGYGGKNLKLT